MVGFVVVTFYLMKNSRFKSLPKTTKYLNLTLDNKNFKINAFFSGVDFTCQDSWCFTHTTVSEYTFSIVRLFNI